MIMIMIMAADEDGKCIRGRAGIALYTNNNRLAAASAQYQVLIHYNSHSPSVVYPFPSFPALLVCIFQGGSIYQEYLSKSSVDPIRLTRPRRFLKMDDR